MFIPSTFKRPVSSWKALNLRKTLLMASSVRDRKSGSAGMPRPISYAVFCLKKKKKKSIQINPRKRMQYNPKPKQIEESANTDNNIEGKTTLEQWIVGTGAN